MFSQTEESPHISRAGVLNRCYYYSMNWPWLRFRVRVRASYVYIYIYIYIYMYIYIYIYIYREREISLYIYIYIYIYIFSAPPSSLGTPRRAARGRARCWCTLAAMRFCPHAYLHTFDLDFDFGRILLESSCVSIPTYMHTCIHAYMHTCVHAYVHTCIRAYVHTCTHAYMHTCYQYGKKTAAGGAQKHSE